MKCARRPQTLAIDDRMERFGGATLYKGSSLEAYESWLPPDCIISDGPYGLGKFPGEPKTPEGLGEWYAAHAAAWYRFAKHGTTLWFWNTELGWAKVHPVLELHGWEYQELVIWDKGLAHVAGNVNSKTIRGLPVVTEVAARYTKRLMLDDAEGRQLSAKEWLRNEWLRSGLPLYQANLATNTANAATRKYLTQCHLWYFPPGEAVVAMARWCEKYGRRTSRPYFSIDGKRPITAREWEELRAPWNHKHGITNVWSSPPVHNGERFKIGSAYLHANQKPLALMRRQIELSTRPGQVIWEPFGGLCSASVAAVELGRLAYAAEVNPDYAVAAAARLGAMVSMSR